MGPQPRPLLWGNGCSQAVSSGYALDGGGVGVGATPPQLALLQVLEERAGEVLLPGAQGWGLRLLLRTGNFYAGSFYQFP